MRTKEHISEGSLTVESGSLADNCIENENLVEPGRNSEEDTLAICDDNNSIPSPNMSSGNVEDINLVANSDSYKSNNDECYGSDPQLATWVRFHYPTTLWMVQSNQS